MGPGVFYGSPSGQIIYGCTLGDSNLCAVPGDGQAAHGIGYGDSVSPDGRWIASAGDQYGSYSVNGSVTVAPISDLQAVKTIWRFTGTDTLPPSWSPDSRTLAVVTGAPDLYTPKRPTPAGLWVMGQNGSKPHLISGAATGPTAWDPSGTHIAFLVGGTGPATTMTVQSIPAAGGAAITPSPRFPKLRGAQ